MLRNLNWCSVQAYAREYLSSFTAHFPFFFLLLLFKIKKKKTTPTTSVVDRVVAPF